MKAVFCVIFFIFFAVHIIHEFSIQFYVIADQLLLLHLFCFVQQEINGAPIPESPTSQSSQELQPSPQPPESPQVVSEDPHSHSPLSVRKLFAGGMNAIRNAVAVAAPIAHEVFSKIKDAAKGTVQAAEGTIGKKVLGTAAVATPIAHAVTSKMKDVAKGTVQAGENVLGTAPIAVSKVKETLGGTVQTVSGLASFVKSHLAGLMGPTIINQIFITNNSTTNVNSTTYVGITPVLQPAQ